jgi:GT2 family glycosyltransferase
LRLSVAVVTYRTDRAMLARCLESLAKSIARAREKQLVSSVQLFLVDNGPPVHASCVGDALGAWPRNEDIRVVSGHGNVGYGAANNLVLGDLRSDIHLVMNPDVELESDAVPAMLEAFRENPTVGLIAPAVVDAEGRIQYLCKRYPTLWVLFLRGFAPPFMRRAFARSLERYEMRDVIQDRTVKDVPLASGCFMAMRSEVFRAVGGFDTRYFMYFEDYDLSLRFARRAQLAYVPAARIVHHGGDAAAKGWRHVLWFGRSAIRFFSRHGWRIA